ncbi:protein of unknown function [Candidatus Hydrogenisulfobacillus filiaventi]|uniref:Uncharacterized protein n=1 Tax=Candidatus Hydrogenisulfobacillus filiaventi TaxID=2707344 RepID=A0A6F8ZGL3_9FIRM|nr:protein of unknown function [Candidatus Hydrogenisulfobacillus filiaventi]
MRQPSAKNYHPVAPVLSLSTGPGLRTPWGGLHILTGEAGGGCGPRPAGRNRAAEGVQA